MVVQKTLDSIVIVARNFNPSIIQEQWLLDKRVFSAGEISGNRLFSDQVVQFATEKVNFLMIPNQLQFTAKDKEIVEPRDYFAGLENLILSLKETPYVAIGINFQWRISDVDVKKFSHDEFYRDDIKILKSLNDNTAKLGTYISVNFDVMRLKLHVLPVEINQEDMVQFDFNFHCNLNNDNRADEIIQVLKKHGNFLQYAKKQMAFYE